jgi:NRAMP (natural resistance-associated macrophage protein)-like metal ion transporter
MAEPFPQRRAASSATPPPPQKRRGLFRRLLSIIGPGVITGAADDDPSGIVTYSVAGAQLGTSMLWTAFLTWPLMSAVQMMCARIGMVTGAGLSVALRKKFPKPVLVVAGLALFLANTLNIGADLSGMGDVMHLLVGLPTDMWVTVFGLVIMAATVRFSYSLIASVLKWLALFLFSYVITAFLSHPNWHQVLAATFLPSRVTGHDQWATLVAILGTTISPYLFFWQASLEVEEDKAKGHLTRASRRGATQEAIIDRKWDVGLGGFFSNFIMYFIILTTALTLHAHNVTHIETSADAVAALRPLAGPFAALIFAGGLIGVGFLAIPTLAGSAAYAFTETFGFRQGLNETLRRARAFYGVIILSILLGIGLTFTPIKPVDALFWTAVINGLLAPILLVGILMVASDRRIMQNQPSSLLGRVVVGLTTLGMFAAAIGLFMS